MQITESPAVEPFAAELEAMAAISMSFLRQTFALLSALEDAGGAGRGGASIVSQDFKRLLLDSEVREMLCKHQDARAWDGMLAAIPYRDRLRALTFVRPLSLFVALCGSLYVALNTETVCSRSAFELAGLDAAEMSSLK